MVAWAALKNLLNLEEFKMYNRLNNAVILVVATSIYSMTPAYAGNLFYDNILQTRAGYGCLDVAKNSPVGDGFNVITWKECHGGTNQVWSSNGHAVTSNGLCLQSENKNIVAKRCDDGEDQKWSLDTNNRTIRSAAGQCLDVVAKGSSAHNVIPYSCHSGPNQTWNLTPSPNRKISRAPEIPDYGDVPVLHDEEALYSRVLPNAYGSQSVKIDCLVSGADSEETSNKITVTWYNAAGKVVGARYRNGISTCHGSNDEWELTKAEEAAYVKISIDGNDGYLMDQVIMYREGKRVRTHGGNDSRGWCLSTDNSDHNTGNFKGHSVDSQCPSTRTFKY